MHPLFDYLRLCRMHWRLGLMALGAVLAARISLLILPFRILQRISATPNIANGAPSVQSFGRQFRIASAVRITSRLVPGATCLTQALAAQALLRLRGNLARLCLGVARNERGGFEAHAWLEANGAVIIGGLPDLDRYQRLPLSGTFQ